MRHSIQIILMTGCLIFLAAACTKKEAAAPSAPLTQEQLVEHGHNVYLSNCTACHGPDPRQNGAVGPSLAGSSLELITARVLRVQYPEGYKPKRSTALMVALPHLEREIPALYAYLNSAK